MNLFDAQVRQAARAGSRPAAPVIHPRLQEVGFGNSWVLSVDAGRRRTPGWLAAVLALLVVALAMYGGATLYRLTPEMRGGDAAVALDRLLQDGCIVGPLLLFALLMIFGVERRGRLAAVIAPARAAELGAGAGVGAYLLAAGLAAAAGAVAVGAGSPGVARWTGLLWGGVLILAQAGCEEAFFRAWLQPVLAARWGAWVGLVASSLLFAAAHAIVQGLGALAFVNDSLAAAAFGLLAYRTGGLYAAIAAHWGWNWVEQSVLGLTPNPGVDPLGSLFDLDLRGPSLLTGGADEMNGSLCATAALLALICCAFLLTRRTANPAVRQS